MIYPINIWTIEKEYNIVYTDYSFKACVKYLCIQLLRVRMGHLLKENIDEYEEYYTEPKAINEQANGSNEIESAEMRNAE